MKLNRLGIRKQIFVLVFGCSMLTLVIAGCVALYGMFSVRNQAIETGVEIGGSAIEQSNENLRKYIQYSMHTLLDERSTHINEIFRSFRWSVESLAKVMDELHANPQNYNNLPVGVPDPVNAGTFMPQLLIGPSLDLGDPIVQREIGLTANLNEWLLRMNESSELADDSYVSSEMDFAIVVDDRSDRKFDENGNPRIIDFRTRPWYRKAVEANGVIFTDIFRGIHTGEAGITCAAPYHYADGTIAGVVGRGLLLNTVAEIVTGTKIGKTGFGFIIGNNGKVLFSPKTEGELVVDGEDEPSLFDAGVDPSLVKAVKLMTSGATGTEEVVIDGKPYYLEYMPLPVANFSFGIAIETSELYAPMELNKQSIGERTETLIDVFNGSIRSMFILLLIVAGLFLAAMPFLGQKIAAIFVEPINKLTDGVREIASGNLDKKIEIHTGNEIEHLAICFNAMTDELKTYMSNLTKVTADKERIATELDVATNIQQDMLPKEFDFNRSDFEIFATMNAAKAVGGDFYDFYMLDEKHLVITIADVSGKGVPAALFMALSKTILKNFAMSMRAPDDFAAVMGLSNQQLCQGNDEMMFVTVFMAMLDLESGRLIYVNGGHNPPMIYHRASDRFEYLDVEQNVVLGMMEDMEFEQQETKLEAGDVIYLYTDGVTEAMDINNGQYGEERLSVCLNGVDKKSPLEKILAAVREDLAKHVGEADQSDDITMLAVRFNGGKK